MEFSLIGCGPFDRLLARGKPVAAEYPPLARRAVVGALVAWLPLVLAALLLRHDPSTITFFEDIEAHARFLLVLPLLVMAERGIGQRTAVVATNFLASGLVDDADVPRFESAVTRARRLLDSGVAEAFLLLLAYVSFWLVFRERMAEDVYWFHARGPGGRLSAAGWWYALVSPLVGFLFLRWIWRYSVWTWFLYRLSRLDLRLSAIHPDRAGGLAFVTSGHTPFAMVFLAASCIVAATAGTEILERGIPWRTLQTPIIVYGVTALAVALAPLFVFRRPLARARRRGTLEYGAVATRYVRSFERKWFGRARHDDELSITNDIQGLADLGGSFERMIDMRKVPFGTSTATTFAIAIALPMLPLVLTAIPLRDVLTFLYKAVI
jgi:hypothetical protein